MMMMTFRFGPVLGGLQSTDVQQGEVMTSVETTRDTNGWVVQHFGWI